MTGPYAETLDNFRFWLIVQYACFADPRAVDWDVRQKCIKANVEELKRMLEYDRSTGRPPRVRRR